MIFLLLHLCLSHAAPYPPHVGTNPSFLGINYPYPYPYSYHYLYPPHVGTIPSLIGNDYSHLPIGGLGFSIQQKNQYVQEILKVQNN